MSVRLFASALVLLFAGLPSGTASAQVAAEVDGEKISVDAVTHAAGQPLAKVEEQAYSLKQQKLNQLIGDRLLAHEADRRKISVDALVKAEITAKVAPVTAADIHALYEANKAQLPNPEAELKDQLQAYLANQRLAARRQEYVASLQSQASVKVYLQAPPPFRTEVTGTGPSRGAPEAPVTIVEFEDFQCPYCKQVIDTVEKVVARYGDKVRLVHRDFPLQSLHPASWKAHEAARCAEKQGKFWEYRALLYANAPAAGVEQLTSYAVQTKLDAPAFKKCLDSGEFTMAIQRDEEEGTRVGVEGTPAFFVNGRLLSGSQPEGEFSRLIDEELSKAARR